MATVPINFTATALPNGARLDWDISTQDAWGYEVYGDIDGAGYVLLATTDAGVDTYTDSRNRPFTAKYRIRAKGGGSGSLSDSIDYPYLRFVFTSTGDGSGVGYFAAEVDENVTARISGGGKFYTNITATEGESTTFALTTGDTRHTCIKVPSGVSVVRMRNVIIKWGDNYTGSPVPRDAWNTGSVGGGSDGEGLNYPSVHIDVTKMTKNTSINVFGLNTLEGDLTGNTIMTYMEIANGYGSHTSGGFGATVIGNLESMVDLDTLDTWDRTVFTGDISGLTKMEVIWLGGYSDIEGSLEGMSDLRTLITYPVVARAAFSGSVNGLTELTVISLQKPCTISGNISNLVKLSQLQLFSTDNLTIDNITNCPDMYIFAVPYKTLSSALVNQLLADLWANRTEAKKSLTGFILLTGAVGSGAPTGQGLTDLAALQAYYPSWTFAVRT